MAADPTEADLIRMTVRELCNCLRQRLVGPFHWTYVVAELERRCTPPPAPDAIPGSFGPHKPCVFCGNTDDMCRGLERSICAPCWNGGKRLPTDVPAPAGPGDAAAIRLADQLEWAAPKDDAVAAHLMRDAAATIRRLAARVESLERERDEWKNRAKDMHEEQGADAQLAEIRRLERDSLRDRLAAVEGQCPWDLPFDSICPKHGGPLAQCPAKQSPFAGLIGGYAAGTGPVKLGVEIPNELWNWDDRKLGDK
jgi:hypothetical protein